MLFVSILLNSPISFFLSNFLRYDHVISLFMIPAIVIGRKGQYWLQGKNTALLAGKPLASYPISAALQSQLVDDVFLLTTVRS